MGDERDVWFVIRKARTLDLELQAVFWRAINCNKQSVKKQPVRLLKGKKDGYLSVFADTKTAVIEGDIPCSAFLSGLFYAD